MIHYEPSNGMIQLGLRALGVVQSQDTRVEMVSFREKPTQLFHLEACETVSQSLIHDA